jgi:hypothetical protein
MNRNSAASSSGLLASGLLASGLLAAALLAAGAAPLRAQGFTLEAYGGYSSLSRASNSANAVFGSTGSGTFGGAVGYVFGSHIYVAAGARYFSKSGTRVFVADASSPPFSLGHPLSARLVPIYGTVGYRFRIGQGAFVPYIGLGGGVTSYHEESTVAGIVDQQSQTKASGHALVGLEFGRGRLRVAAEGLYSTVPDAIGVGGVSQVYGEKDLGGFTVLGKVVFSLTR